MEATDMKSIQCTVPLIIYLRGIGRGAQNGPVVTLTALNCDNDGKKAIGIKHLAWKRDIRATIMSHSHNFPKWTNTNQLVLRGESKNPKGTFFSGESKNPKGTFFLQCNTNYRSNGEKI